MEVKSADTCTPWHRPPGQVCASPKTLVLIVHFDGKRVTLEGSGVDWEGTVSIEGWQE